MIPCRGLKILVEAGCHLCTLIWQTILEDRAETITSNLVPVTMKIGKYGPARQRGIAVASGLLTESDRDRGSVFKDPFGITLRLTQPMGCITGECSTSGNS